MSARVAPKESRVLVISGPRTRTRNGILQESTTPRTNSESLFSFSLFATLEDNKSEEEPTSIPAPRRTRRIDDILDEYEVTGDAGRTISVLESSLKREQEKSGTLAIRLAYAEQVIAEQKERLAAKRSSLQKKSQALSESQKKLKELEQRLVPFPPMPTAPPKQASQSSLSPSVVPAPWQQPPLLTNERQYPLITNWSMKRHTGEVTGTVSCHPSIPDGTTIVTSGLNPESFAMAGDGFVFESDKPATVVTTRSGSMYQLGVKKIRRPPTQGLPNPSVPASFQQIQDQLQLHPANNLNPNLEFPLTGQSISTGRGAKYLLAGQPKRKPSGRSEIVMAYKCDTRLMVCDSNTPYVFKLSTGKGKLLREYENYRLVQEQTVEKNKNNGWIGGISNLFDQQDSKEDPFVACYDFLPVCEGSIKYAQHSALVLEKGHEDLRDYEYRSQERDDPENPPETPTTMDPAVVKSSLLVAAKCLQVLHSRARLVWTDLKAENLVFMKPQDLDNASENIVTIKGVDLESAVPHRVNPLDYTPEACPPEFAHLHLNGNAYDFVLEYSYDVWSFGMLAYELATGSAYFRGKTPAEIMAVLGDPNFVPPLSNEPASATEAYDGSVSSNHVVTDKDLRELVQACLRVDPRRRISVRNILNHPYFQKQPQQSEYNNDQAAGSGTFW